MGQGCCEVEEAKRQQDKLGDGINDLVLKEVDDIEDGNKFPIQINAAHDEENGVEKVDEFQ